MAPAASVFIFCHLTPTGPHLLRRITTFPRLSIVAAARENPHNVSRKPNRVILRAKHDSTLVPLLSQCDTTNLLDTQAIGTVAAAQANFMRVIVHSLPSGSSTEGKIGVELLCVVKTLLKKIKMKVLVGDEVVLGSIDWVERMGVIEDVFPRSTEISDPPLANVDYLVVLFSFEQPKLEPFMLTRFLVEAESTGIPFMLVLNKSDLVDEETLAAWKSRLHSWGYDPIFCSVESNIELDTIAFILRDQTAVIVGPSGVGKSSLINALRDNPLASSVSEVDNRFDPMLNSKWFEDQRVGEVSARSGRGKHTTRNVSLLPLSGGGYLADTPGFNQPTLLKVTKQSLAQTFPEIRNLVSASETKCSFKNCMHLSEPGCIVKGDWERYPFYFRLLDEISVREKVNLRKFGTKKESTVRFKVGSMGVRQAEPRLEPKKHRRHSRKSLNQSIVHELDELHDYDSSLDEEN